jgi:hypothetical protein
MILIENCGKNHCVAGNIGSHGNNDETLAPVIGSGSAINSPVSPVVGSGSDDDKIRGLDDLFHDPVIGKRGLVVWSAGVVVGSGSGVDETFSPVVGSGNGVGMLRLLDVKQNFGVE